MKKAELKNILKPLIKECIKECIFEDGVLSGIITEVTKGLSSQRLVTEASVVHKDELNLAAKQKKAEELERDRQEKIKKLNESMSFGEVNIFEGTKEIVPESSNHGPMSGIAANDAGVDIRGILNLAEGKWKHLM